MGQAVQEIALYSLSRTDFFDHSAFIGGTALRIFHGLDRFSEDLDFALVEPDPDFDMGVYLPTIEEYAASFGLRVEAKEKRKASETGIESSMIRGNTREMLVLFYPEDSRTKQIPYNDVVKVKMEVNIDPPEGAAFEKKMALLPYPYAVQLYDYPSLFAGKLNAVLSRGWKNRTKGRDLYDFVHYIKHDVPVNMGYLASSLVKKGFVETSDGMDLDEVRSMLVKRFGEIDYEAAKLDVIPFANDPRSYESWCPELFIQLTDSLRAV
ncbi:MAG: nucleotidyl transferase AbiEii/AbiGii toxin family protein [Thermoplasmata archaeon]|nr:nucleotidyl transferase AbiEii/AbiGii toxin family protein [Thermoplasmata archaeon]